MLKFIEIILFICYIWNLLFQLIYGHVVLTFPPARKYQLDFLDSIRTDGACGMFEGNLTTSFVVNSKVKITWDLGYSHKGGISLDLLDANGFHLRNLTDGYVSVKDPTLQEYLIDLPTKLECQKCVIRLQRQALEWGPNYLFRSCSDVSIVKPENYQITCSGHGTVSVGSNVCQCQQYYKGTNCEIYEECASNYDCGSNRGSCLVVDSKRLIRHCFCNPGYFGRHCEKISVLDTKTWNSSLYQKVSLSASVSFYWRIVTGQLEALIEAETTSFLAVGWRPLSIDKSCQKFPFDAPVPRGNQLNGMDCTDIIVGSAKGGLSRIADYYTRDRSTPRIDEFYGGSQDLEAAIGWEENGTTTIMFRRRISGSSHESDHAFEGNLHLIWAYGQESQDDFYSPDALKYHGRNRGIDNIVVPSSSGSNKWNKISLIMAAVIICAKN